MNDASTAPLISVLLSVLIVIIELSKPAKSSPWGILRFYSLLYLVVVIVGNLFTTYSAMTYFNTLPDTLPKGFVYAFMGVFGFEGILKNISVTLFGSLKLSINDYISGIKDRAIADVIESFALKQEMDAQKLAQRLKTLPTQDLNAHVNALLGNGQVQALEQEAQQAHADPQFVKALALAKDAYLAALAISPP
jgi:hypothetical protein